MFDLSESIDKAMAKFAAIDDRINASTFGRVFRLDGSGHVSYRYYPRFANPLSFNMLYLIGLSHHTF